MAERRKPSKPKAETPGEDRHKNPPLGLRFPVELINAMRVAAAQDRRSLTTEITIALEEFLKAKGLWPPPATPATPSADA